MGEAVDRVVAPVEIDIVGGVGGTALERPGAEIRGPSLRIRVLPIVFRLAQAIVAPLYGMGSRQELSGR